MKKIIISFVLLFLASHAFCQVTLTSANNPAPGNSEIISDCDSVGIVPGSPGANQTWNFTNIVRRDSSLISWVSSSSTPYSGQFASSNVASTNDNSNYHYFTSSGTNLITNGTAGPLAVIPYSNPELFMQYPFTFNSSFSDVFSANYLLNGIPTVRTGTINVSGDAWGTINLPLGSFTNALRVKYVILTKDSSNPGVPIVITTSLTSYVWFAPGRKFPVFEIVYTDVTINDIPQTPVKSVSYTVNNIPIGIMPISNLVPDKFNLHQNYPNPFNPSTKIRVDIANSGHVDLKVYDILGKEVAELVNQQLATGSYEVDWNAAEKPGGVYFYRLSSNGFTQTHKMILIK
jgi:hypothetical protein